MAKYMQRRRTHGGGFDALCALLHRWNLDAWVDAHLSGAKVSVPREQGMKLFMVLEGNGYNPRWDKVGGKYTIIECDLRELPG
jgi:hypothetical protein